MGNSVLFKVTELYLIMRFLTFIFRIENIIFTSEMTGYVGHLSLNQQFILDQFQERVADVLQPYHDDYFLLRWLRARNFNLEKSEFMLRESLKVRQNLGLDTILDAYIIPEVLQKYYPGGYFGYDKEGAPVFVDPIGRVDFKGLLSSIKKDEVIRFKAYTGEYGLDLASKQTEKLGRRVDQLVIVMDMEGLGMKHLWKPGVMTFNEVATFYEDNFPEVMKNILIIRAPKLFPVAYALVKPFLSEATKNKVHILGDDWKRELQEYISADNLPLYYGGSCTDPDGDPRCSSRICYGGDVPESFYVRGQAYRLTDSYQSGIVKRGSTLKLDYEVIVPGSILSWEFKSEDHDIGFGVYFSGKTEDKYRRKEMIELIPSRRLDCHLIPEQGSVTCWKRGTYILRFDNTYSWTRNKKIMFYVEVLEPDEQDGHLEDYGTPV